MYHLIKHITTTTFDLRSLGLFRIVLGVAIVYNLIFYRFPAVGVYYNNKEWLPVASASDYYGSSLPLFTWLESDIWYYFLFIVMLLLSILYMIGFKTKWVTPVLFVLFGSMVTTNPYVSHGVEYLEETALFWSMFLPIGYSFTWFKNRGNGFFNFGKLGQFGFQIQLFLIYFSSWIFKNGELWKTGRLLEVVSNDLIHARPLLQWLGEYPAVAQLSTYFGFYLEIVVSILLLLSIFSHRTKIYAAFGIIFMHGIMACFLHVGTFFLVGLAFGLLMLPSSLWNRILIKSNVELVLQQVKPFEKIYKWRLVKNISMAMMILFVAHGNLHHWSKDSYLSHVLSKVPFYHYTIGRQIPDPGIFTGLWHQSWKFFANNIYEDFGDFLYIGYNEKGEPLELRTNQVLTISTINNKVQIKPLPTASYFGSEFTFAVYYKFYQDRFPVSTQAGWLNLQLDTYKKKYPGMSISRAELWKLKRYHKFENEQLIIKDTVYKLTTIN